MTEGGKSRVCCDGEGEVEMRECACCNSSAVDKKRGRPDAICGYLRSAK
jgi:hypothetical protein